MNIKSNIKISIDINTDGGKTICTIENGQIFVLDKKEILSIKAVYYVVSYNPDCEDYQQFTIRVKSNNYYYDCTINPVNRNKQLLVTDSYNNTILTIDGNLIKNAIEELYNIER